MLTRVDPRNAPQVGCQQAGARQVGGQTVSDPQATVQAGGGAPEPFVLARDAAFPRPVANVLEFNAPVHENWNIVHTGMLVPEAHQIYVCADNCLRGVVLTAAEMGASERFSSVVIEEGDLLTDNLETITIEGVSDVIRKLDRRPPAVMVFLVCLHHFVGTDVDYVYRELQKRFPDIFFMRCWMDPIMQKTGITPEQRERKAMVDPLEPLPQNERLVSVLSDDLRLPESSDLVRFLNKAGFEVRQLHDCHTWHEYLELGASTLFLTRSFFGNWGLQKMAARLGRKALYLPPALAYDSIDEELGQLAQALGVDAPNTGELRAQVDQRLDALATKLAGAPVAIDYLAVNHPLELARTLLQHGLNVQRVYVDAVSTEEKSSLEWLAANAPKLELWSTIHPKLRQVPRDGGSRWLAVGPKAAWFLGTDRFVNIIETDGQWGYAALLHLADLMDDAWANPKDPRGIVPQKGLGMPCVCQLPR